MRFEAMRTEVMAKPFSHWVLSKPLRRWCCTRIASWRICDDLNKDPEVTWCSCSHSTALSIFARSMQFGQVLHHPLNFLNTDSCLTHPALSVSSEITRQSDTSSKALWSGLHPKDKVSKLVKRADRPYTRPWISPFIPDLASLVTTLPSSKSDLGMFHVPACHFLLNHAHCASCRHITSSSSGKPNLLAIGSR